MAQKNRTRFYSDFYDSVSQRSYPLLFDQPKERTKAYLGRMRFDTLLSETLVLTDAQVLDGSFFVSTEFEQIAQFLKRKKGQRRLPIEIRARATTVEQSLIELFTRPDRPDNREYLAAVSLSSLEEGTREQVRSQLKTIRVSKIRSWTDIPGILVDCGVDQHTADRLRERWGELIAKADAPANKRQLQVVQRDRGFDIDTHLGNREDLQLYTEEGKKRLRKVWEARKDRNQVVSDLDSWNPRTFDGRCDRWSILRWFNMAYNSAAAAQHLCRSNFESIYAPWDRSDPMAADMERVLLRKDVENLIVESDKVELELLPEIVLRLGSLTPSDYADLFDAIKSTIKKWWEGADRAALRKAAKHIVKELLPMPTPKWDYSSVFEEMKSAAWDAGLKATVYDPEGTLKNLILGPLAAGIRASGSLTLDYYTTRALAHIESEAVTQRIIWIADERTKHDV